ncbi:MAG: oxidoreductase domain protein, partial [Phycisphaerales bacterium]|nr:oxidoreductase domain protein [Phycisphaerales bacterium]
MKRKTSIALMGIGGYGRIYVKPLLDAALCDKHGVQLIAGVDPVPGASQDIGSLRERDIPVYLTAAELYTKHRPEVVVLASPLQYHAQQTIEALAHGCHVLCEKPLCVTIEQARQMKAAKDRSANQVAIGYQWSFSPAIQTLKADILAGDFGAPRRCKSLVLWPRDEVYYTRNGWAGRRATAAGLPVMDSPLNNACAHFLHNLLYLLGPRTDRSAMPSTVAAELYRANAIETFDTCAVRARVAGDVEVLTIFSHATAEVREPVFEMEFDRATVTYTADRGRDGRLIATFRDGTRRDYGRPSS